MRYISSLYGIIILYHLLLDMFLQKCKTLKFYINRTYTPNKDSFVHLLFIIIDMCTYCYR